MPPTHSMMKRFSCGSTYRVAMLPKLTDGRRLVNVSASECPIPTDSGQQRLRPATDARIGAGGSLETREQSMRDGALTKSGKSWSNPEVAVRRSWASRLLNVSQAAGRPLTAFANPASSI